MKADFETRRAFDRIILETGMIQIRMPHTHIKRFAEKLGMFDMQPGNSMKWDEAFSSFTYRGVKIFGEPIKANEYAATTIGPFGDAPPTDPGSE